MTTALLITLSRFVHEKGILIMWKSCQLWFMHTFLNEYYYVSFLLAIMVFTTKYSFFFIGWNRVFISYPKEEVEECICVLYRVKSLTCKMDTGKWLATQKRSFPILSPYQIIAELWFLNDFLLLKNVCTWSQIFIICYLILSGLAQNLPLNGQIQHVCMLPQSSCT